MTVRALVGEIHELIEQKAPKGTSPFAILKKAIDTYPSGTSREANVSEEQAKEILLARGAVARKKLEMAGGGSISAEQVADILNLTRQGVDYLRKTKSLVAWRNTSGKWHYPLWQFDRGRIRPGIRECLRALASQHPWNHMLFFLSPRESLGGKRPLDLIVKGDIAKAAAVARRHDQHGAH
jgi:hypothetical protein